ncbi:MAG: IS630 family transposase [Chloroflexi bacterium]|nr:IS630 family transposase [Chloroflexota bacterium]
MDETTISLHPPLRRCWTKRGKRQLIPAPGSPQYLHVFGAYNWRNGQVTHCTSKHKNSDAFIAFLDRLLHLHPRLKLILVLDNASYHRSKAVQAALSHWGDRLLLIWLPKYSPFLNPIERFWLHFKQLTVANRLHRSPDDLQITVDQVIANQNTPDHPNRLLFVDNFRLVA